MAVEILNIDCMEYMARQPDNAFDLAIVDPPYGLGIDGQKYSQRPNGQQNRKKHKRKHWDSQIPSAQYFSELSRVSVNQIIWGANYFVKHISLGTKGWIFWYKGQEGLTMSDGEIAFSSFNKPTRIVNIHRSKIWREKPQHPTQKPVLLYQWLLTRYAKPGQRILDTHLGSGSSAIAAYYYGCDFVGCEIDREYINGAKERFDNETSQAAMF